MSQERADLNWYHNPPDYFSGRDRAARAGRTAEAPPAQTAQRVMAGPEHETAAGEFTFDDFLDIINPLHHLPVISSIYREVTGDQISAHARILGGGLFGGGTGFVGAIANAISEEATGRDLGDNLMAAVFGDDEGEAETVAAKAAPGAAPQNAADPGPETVTDGGAATPALPAEQLAPSSAAPEAVAPDGPPLEGAAALNALFADLRGRPRDPAGAEAPSTAERTTPAQSHETARPDQPPPGASGPGGIVLDPALFAPQSQGPAGPAAPEEGRPGFTDQMLLGLQKYEEMMGRRPTTQAGLGPGDEPGG